MSNADLIVRLRARRVPTYQPDPDCSEAADAIAALTKTIASLRDVLEDLIPLVPVIPENSTQIYRASATLAEGIQKW